jgi:wyosine [tRNA(Phe)-imidazoG37] synthetase (radical SAM superfamily)
MRYVFGPVPSRRLGFSLGLDLTGRKLCSLDCVYCQLGPTPHKTVARWQYVPIDQIISELKRALRGKRRIDFITLSGSGEPTLNSQIGPLIKAIKKMTKIPVAVLTNGTLLTSPRVFRTLLNADMVAPSLDAVSQAVFRNVNRPHESLKAAEIVKALVHFGQRFTGQIWLEILFVKGVNDSASEVARLVRQAERIKPDKIHLNTVVRPPAEADAKPVSQAFLRRIAKKFSPLAQCIAESHHGRQTKGMRVTADQIVRMAKRRPVTLQDICNSLGLSPNQALKIIERLLSSRRLSSRVFRGKRYYE